MKLIVKKVYCSQCRILVKPREESEKAGRRLVCPRCQGLLYVYDGFAWRRSRREVAAANARPGRPSA